MSDRLIQILSTISRPAIAVSGGVDSMTLAALATRRLHDVKVLHAVSAAVPAEATARVKKFAETHGWSLELIDAGEFRDPNYRANPVNRCFYCKTNLYQTIRLYTDRQILSGANLDDLGEYRPGLDAARNNNVRHPYIEAGLAKAEVRHLARTLGLEGVSELPASPCLSSRVETGIRIEASTLAFIHEVESLMNRQIRPATVRCRVRSRAIVIELDASSLAALTREDAEHLTRLIEERPERPTGLPIAFAPYRNGSAFLVETAS